MVEKEVPETYLAEVRGYAVRALYPYQSKTFNVTRGEILELKEKSNEEWWLVENSNGKEGFAPANYLKELGIQRIAKQRVRMVKKSENIQVKRIVPRSSQAMSAATALAAATVLLINQKDHLRVTKKDSKAMKLRRKTTSIQPRQLQHLGTESLQKRQIDITNLYGQLFSGSIEKRKQLDNSISFYKWLRKFDELDRWVKDMKQKLSVDKENSLLDHPDEAKRRHQAFNTDFLANQNEYTELVLLANQLSDKKTSFNDTQQNIVMSSEEVMSTQAALAKEWQQLMDLKKYWDNAVKAIQCIDRFNLLHADANDLLNEKMSASAKDDVSADTNDIKSVRALQSKQDKLERDIGPIETNVNELRKTADEVCKYFPQENANVQKKLSAVDELWFTLRDDVKTRKAKLDEKHGLQRFENEVHDFQEVCAKISVQLQELEAPLDLKQCEDMQKKYEDLEQEFNSEVTFKFNDLKMLSQKQLAKRGVIGSVEKINSQLSLVASERDGTVKCLDDKGKYLCDFHRYLKFKEDANSFELLMVGQVN